MNSRRQPWILWVAFLIGVTGSLWSAFDRNKIEQSSKQVELVLDYDSIVDLSAKEGVPITSILSKAKQSGITAIALPEMTLERLQFAGKLKWYSGDELLKDKDFLPPGHKLKNILQIIDISPSNIYVIGNINIINDRVSNLLGDNRIKIYTTGDPNRGDNVVLEIIGKSDDLKVLGLGTDSKDANLIETKYGFHILPRLENKENITEEKISFLLDSIKPFSIVVFSGIRNEALGYRKFINYTADLMKKHNLIFGAVEVYDKGKMQKGAQTLARLLPEQTVRVQTIPPLQMAKITPDRAVDMFMLGVRERNIRVLYLRPFMMIPDMEFSANETKNLIDLNMSFFENLSNELKSHGFKTGQTSIFPLLENSLLISIFAVIGVIGAFALVTYYCGYLFKAYFYLAAILLVVIITAICWRQEGLYGVWSKGMAILTGIVFSVLAGLVGWKLFLKNDKKVTFWLAILSSCIMAVISVIGGLVIAALLRGNLYMLGIDQVRGIKLILLVPPLLVFLILYAMRCKESGNWMIDGASIKELFKYKVSVWHLALLGVFMGIVLLLLVRSGNTGEELVPAWERAMRNTIEQYLIVRPRFKEFLLGYPAIFIGAYFLQRGYKQMVPFAAFFATIGLSNCIDTFAHLHTPLWVAFLRTFHALWIGVVLGIILWLSLILSDKILLKIENSSSGSKT